MLSPYGQNLKYVVPNNFSNHIIGQEDIIVYGNKLLESNMTTNSYIPEEGETPYSIKINVNVDNYTSNVSSKITIDDSESYYFDGGNINFTKDRQSFPNSICVSSVPYKVKSDENKLYCLIYDHLKTEDVFYPKQNNDVLVTKYQYKASDSDVYIYLEFSEIFDCKSVANSIKIYEIKNGTLHEVGTIDPNYNSDLSDKIDARFVLDHTPSIPFGFVSFILNSEYKALPIYFKMNATRFEEFKYVDDFSDLYFNQFEIAQENNSTYSCDTIQQYIFKDHNDNITVESEGPFL